MRAKSSLIGLFFAMPSFIGCGFAHSASTLENSSGAGTSYFNSDGSSCYGQAPCGRYKVVDGTAMGGNTDWYGSSDPGYIVAGPFRDYGSNLGAGAYGHLHALVDVLIEMKPNTDPVNNIQDQAGWVDVDFTYDTGRSIFASTTLSVNSAGRDGSPGVWQSVQLDGGVFQAPAVRNQVEIRVHNARSKARYDNWVPNPSGGEMEENGGTDAPGSMHIVVGSMTILYN